MLPICFCVDQRMLAGLHVAARSILESLAEGLEPHFHVFSDDLSREDFEILRKTLSSTSRQFELSQHTVAPEVFSGFPELGNSLATYYRLVIPEVLGSGRVFYIDADTLCRINISPLFEIDLEGSPIALAAEAPIDAGPDPRVNEMLGEQAHGHYFNAGVMVLDIDAWRKEDLTNRCLSWIAETKPTYHDQSALNFVLHGRINQLDDRYNCRTNVRRFWPSLKSPELGDGTILHFVDFPKPWSRYGNWVHPFGKLWWKELDKTAFGQSKVVFQEPIIPESNRRSAYKLMFKDRLLFSLHNRGIRVKGAPR